MNEKRICAVVIMSVLLATSLFGQIYTSFEDEKNEIISTTRYRLGPFRLFPRLLIEELGLGKDKLWVSVYKDDDEAYKIWKDLIKVPGNKIIKLGDKENFWPSQAKEKGPNGPCGPCSEIHVDRGPGTCDQPEGHTCGVNSGCARYMEIWNLVFIQNDRAADGSLGELPAKHVDTGMGLERVTALLQGVDGNYDCDLMRGLILPNRLQSDYPGNRRQGQVDHANQIIFRKERFFELISHL